MPNLRFDAVSCQFALHYSFQTEAQAKQLLLNATERLKPGGFFFCTVPDAYVLVKKLRAIHASQAEKSFGNKFYKITFEKDKFPDKNGAFGLKYHFQLKDTEDDSLVDCPEYLVHPRKFVRLAKQFKLNVTEELNFHEFYEKYSQNEYYGGMLAKQVKRNGIMNNEEWDTSCTFFFL